MVDAPSLKTTGAIVALGAACALLVGCGDAASAPSFFAIRSVTARMSPPCVAPALGAAPAQNRPIVACYELGPTAVTARDVSSALVRPNANTETIDVEFALTPAGVERFNAMARALGIGGQAAIVVDGGIVSAPRLDTTDFPGRGVITGLDLVTAQGLAARLNAGTCVSGRPLASSHASGIGHESEIC